MESNRISSGPTTEADSDRGAFLSGGTSMSETNAILQALGRIEGKVDEIKDAAKEHRDDDKRRFTELHHKVDENRDEANRKFAEHAQDINQAKGAKGALMWVASGVAAFVGMAVTLIGKKMGWL